MKIQSKLSVVLLFLLTIVLTGCNALFGNNQIKELPADAVRVMSMDLTARSGTYTVGKIDISGNGYIILDVTMHSGTMGALGIKDTIGDKTVFSVKGPVTALYSSEPHEYQESGKYELSLVNAKNITGDVVVYFVPEEPAE